MITRLTTCAALLAALLSVSPASAASGHDTGHVALVARDNVTVFSRPVETSEKMAVLVQQTSVEALGSSAGWTRVKFWASLTGWVHKSDLTSRKPWSTVSTYRAPQVHYRVHAHPSQPLRAAYRAVASAPVFRAPGLHPTGTSLRLGTAGTTNAWQQDSKNGIWYRIRSGWVYGDAVQLNFPDPSRQQRSGQALWKSAAGKGMWLTLGTITGTAPDVLVKAAQSNGITHLYLETAISPLGFHGRDSVGPLLDAAHARHIAVFAWVYPYLYDLASDVALSRQVAAFRTPAGTAFDGIAEDLEQNVSLSTVHNFSQLARAYLGNQYPLVGVTYPPQDFSTYPFAEVARIYNLIAPMDYWHQTRTANGLDYDHMPYGFNYGYRFAQDSVATIQRVSGHVPVAPIGQVFDDFGRLEMGPHAPSAAEINGFLQGCKASGAVGASFFQWMTATDDEWRAIHAFRY